MKRRDVAPAADPRHRDPANASAAMGQPAPEERPSPPSAGSVEIGRDRIDLAGLSVAGITRRRVGWLVAAMISAWIVLAFARQVGEATSATNRAAQLAADNAALATEVQALQGELDRIVRPEYVALAARGYQLGDPREIPFTLDPSVSAPVDGAPGSASARLGGSASTQSPLDSWLSLLFGPTN